MVRILIADDDANVRDLASRALQSAGHQVDCVSDGSEALDHVKANGAPDVLVTDIDMPQLDGISLAKDVGTQSPNVAILLMSGYSEQLARASEIKAAKVATIQKPFTLDAIRQSVRAIVG